MPATSPLTAAPGTPPEGRPAVQPHLASPTRPRAEGAEPRRLLRGLGWGAAQGALLYGGAVSLLHLLHNRDMGLGPVDALALLGWCLLLYGGLALAGIGAPLLLAALLPGGGQRAAGAGALPRWISARALPRWGRDLWLASTLFHAVFWFFVTCYGLTYDQVPAFVQVAWQMVAWLALRGVLVLLVAALASRVLVAALVALHARGRVAAVLGALALALVVAHLALGLFPATPAAPAAVPPRSALDGGGGAKVAIVAVDGADWRVALPLVRAGRMPHLARLMAEGAWGPLRSFPDSNSAVLWASIYTGRLPQAHGVQDFFTIRLPGMSRELPGVFPVHRTFFKELALRLQQRGMGELTPIDRSSLRVPPVWEIAQSRGLPVGVVDGYYYSYPAPRLADPASFFLAYGSDGIWQQSARAGHRPVPADAGRYASPPALMEEVGPILARPDFEWQMEALRTLLSRQGQPPLVSTYSHQPDAVQHESWRFYEPRKFLRVDPRTAAARDRIVPFYLSLDAWLGRLQGELAPGTVLVLVSDHGHAPTLFHSMDTQHRHGPPGILLLHGDGVRPGRITGAGVLDVLPTVLRLLALPVPDDGDGRVLEQALSPQFLAAHPLRRVASWSGLPKPPTAIEIDPARRAEELEKLRALGYIR